MIDNLVSWWNFLPLENRIIIIAGFIAAVASGLMKDSIVASAKRLFGNKSAVPVSQQVIQQSQRVIVNVASHNVPPEDAPDRSTNFTAAPLPRSPAIGIVLRRDKEGHDIIGYASELLSREDIFIVLWGEGGVGKTVIAAELARRHDLLVWASADGRPEFSLGTLVDAALVQLGRGDLRARTSIEKIEVSQKYLADARPLVVLDNFETIIDRQQTLIIEFLQSAQCPVVVTSRKKISQARNIAIDAMNSTEATEFVSRLIEISPRQDVFAELDRQEIIKIASSNPKIMEWIIAQIEESKQPWQVFEELGRGEGDAAKRVFERSFNLPYLGDSGRLVLLALALFALDASREALMTVTKLNANDCDEAIKRLVMLRLAETTILNTRVSVTGLTRELILKHPDLEKFFPDWSGRFVSHLTRLVERSHSENFPKDLAILEAERENIFLAMNYAVNREDWDSVKRLSTIIVGYTPILIDEKWGKIIARARELNEAVRKREEPVQPEISYRTRHIRISLTRTNDHDQDVMRMRELFRLITSTQGRDRFTFFVPNPNGIVQLDFPNYTTSYRVIEDHLTKMVRDWGTMDVH